MRPFGLIVSFVKPRPPTKLQEAIGRLLKEAEEAWGRQDYQKSLQLIEQATRKEPSNPGLLLELARAHGLRYDLATAERYIEKAVQLSPSRAQTLADAGRICLDFEQVDMAIRYLERAGQKNSVPIGSLMTLADIYIRDGRLDDAANLVTRAAQVDRKDSRVLLEDAALRRLNGKGDEAESMIRTLLADSAVSVPVRVRGYYDLAGILDSTGRYDDAMSALLEVKAIQRAHAAPYTATLLHMQKRAQEMEQTLTAQVLARWRVDGEKLQPPRRIALLAGHPRSGTTLLEQVLDAHPDIISAEETKLMHDEAYLPLIRDFPEGTSILQALDSSPPSLLCHARENYFRCNEMLMQKSIGNRLLVDKNPGLNLMIPIIVRVFPETKLLIALRDPRDVIISCFQQALPLTPISSAYLSIESTVQQYASAMGFWLDMRPRMGEQWLQVRYEEMIEDLQAVARTTLNFLGVAFDENVLKFYEHARTKRVKSPSHADVQKPVYRTAMGRWRNYQKYLDPYMTRLNRFLDAFNYH
jgi:tetratricopeptide (TPR) repeat protein